MRPGASQQLCILTGPRDASTGLWHLGLVSAPLPDPPSAPDPEQISLAAVAAATPADLVAFAHAALFSPALSTLQFALDRGYVSDFPGLTAQTLCKYPPVSIPMIKGHLDQSRTNQHSTKPAIPGDVPPSPEASDDDTLLASFPPSDPTNDRTHHCFAAVFEPASGQIHTNPTGRFIVASSSGNNYILVLYEYDSNSILVEPMLNRTGACILRAFKVLRARLVAAGLRPHLQRLDNECSAALKTFLRDKAIDFQLVPPGLHRRNAAECAIRTFKNHFIAGLCSVNKDFPLHLWDHLLPQAETTLNLLRGSHINPKLSAYAQLHGHFDYNRTPMAPPGIRVLVHVKPVDRTSWSPHAEDGWYTGPAFDSYRCYRVWIWASSVLRICDTLTWLPTKLTLPVASSDDRILAGIHTIVQALQQPAPASPLAPLPATHHDALLRLTALLQAISDPPVTTPLAALPSPPAPSLPGGDTSTPGASLRVAASTLVLPLPPLVPAPPHSPSLRVPTPVSPLTTVGPPQRTVHFAPLPSDILGGTFRNSTGLRGTKRRKARRRGCIPPALLSTAKTLHPNAQQRPARPASVSPPVVAPKSPTRHPHGTRLDSRLRLAAQLRHVSAASRNVILAAARHEHIAAAHFALHGNAFNPDTGKLAEYCELSQCSEGALWQGSNADEIGRLAQGYIRRHLFFFRDYSLALFTQLCCFVVTLILVANDKMSSFVRCVGCTKSFKRLSTHLAQNAVCAAHYYGSHISTACDKVATNPSITNDGGSSFQQEVANTRLNSRSSSRRPALLPTRESVIEGDNELHIGNANKVDDNFVVDDDDDFVHSSFEDNHPDVPSEEEEGHADHSVFDLYEKLFKLRSNPLGLERFSLEEKVQIELLQLLRDLKAPLKAFTLVLNWAAKSNASGHVFKEGCQPSREKVMRNLYERYNMNGLIPKEKQLYLPYSQRTVSVVYFDASEVFASLLSCPTLNQDEIFLFDSAKDPFVAPSGKASHVGDIKTGRGYRKTYKALVKDIGVNILLPCIMAMDKTHIDMAGRLQMEPITLSHGLLKHTAYHMELWFVTPHSGASKM
ncbi:hypothetical protein MHU86_3160 [Fragilaria crotonensis]|nr:hypothetical protein MHU86_3160 [Fragilaria crotonensis]